LIEKEKEEENDKASREWITLIEGKRIRILASDLKAASESLCRTPSFAEPTTMTEDHM